MNTKPEEKVIWNETIFQIITTNLQIQQTESVQASQSHREKAQRRGAVQAPAAQIASRGPERARFAARVQVVAHLVRHGRRPATPKEDAARSQSAKWPAP